jgi:hypothetical protein
MLFAILGSFSLWRKNQTVLSLLVAVIGADVLLYSMWGDPWGGWAYGSRYLIPAYAMCSILIAVALEKFGKNKLFVFLFLIVGLYSIFVNTLGALTTSANPPKVQILALEKQTHKPQKYTYERNIDYLKYKGSKSFMYNTFLEKYITPAQFYLIVASVISFAEVTLLIVLNSQKYE